MGNIIFEMLFGHNYIIKKTVKYYKNHSFETRPDPTGRPGVGTGPG